MSHYTNTIWGCDLCAKKQTESGDWKTPPQHWRRVEIGFQSKNLDETYSGGREYGWNETFVVCGECIGPRMDQAKQSGFLQKIFTLWSGKK